MQDTTQDAAFYPTMPYGMPKRHVRGTAPSTVCLTRSSIAVRRGRPQCLLVPNKNPPPNVTAVRRRVVDVVFSAVAHQTRLLSMTYERSEEFFVRLLRYIVSIATTTH